MHYSAGLIYTQPGITPSRLITIGGTMKTLDNLYINGHWQASASNAFIDVINPSTNQLFLRVPQGNAEDVDLAVTAARQALPAWSASLASVRAQLMRAVATEMRNRYDELVDAHVKSMGCPRHMTGAFHVDAPIEAMEYYADLAYKMEAVGERDNVLLLKEPVGVCAFINPWNYPLHQLIGKVAPALAAGCTIVAKPAEQTPELDFLMADIFHTVGLPAGVFNLVSGVGTEIGPVMSSHPQVDMVSFTGSTRAGIQVATAAAPGVKRVCQELGGKSAYIITPDADLAAAVRYGIEDVMANTGQTCNALTRMLVHQDCYEQVLELAAEIAAEQVVGDPDDPATTMGPMASQRQKQTVQDYIRLGLEEGARLITGGTGAPENLPEHMQNGAFVRPTVFADVTNQMRIAREEIFGPVLCILTYNDIDEAVDIANDTDYGLSSGVFARDAASAIPIARRLQAGQCYIQGAYFSMDAPFGGYKQSGNGREWGEHGMDEYMETKAIICG